MPMFSEEINKNDTNDMLYEHCQELFKALDGDLVSTASIADMLQNTGSHFRTLIASLLTGNTKFHSKLKWDDSSSNTPQSAYSDITAQLRGENQLLQEVFRFFELAVREHFGATHPSEQVERFIKSSFSRNIPIYLLVLIVQDKKMLESLINVQETFGVGLILRKKISQLSNQEQNQKKIEMEDYMKNLYHFLHTENSNSSIRPLLRYLFNLKQDDDEAQILQIQPLPNFVVEQEQTQEKQIQMMKEQDLARIPVNIVPFLDLVYKCWTSQDVQSAVAHLFGDVSFLYQYIQFQPEAIRDLFVILRNNLLEEKKDLQNTTKLLKIILFSQNLQTQLSQHTKQIKGENSTPTTSNDVVGDEQKDNNPPPPVDEAQLISLVSAWFDVVNLILSKENPTQGGHKDPYLTMQETLTSTLKMTQKCYGSDKLLAFANKTPEYIAQVLTGLIYLSKGDVIGCKPLAQKLGGYPDDAISLQKFKDVVELIDKNREGFKFSQEDVESQQRSQKEAEWIVAKVPIAQKTAEDILAKAIENPLQMLDPLVLFKHFTTNRTVIGFEEFNNIFVQLNLKIPYVRRLKIFSEADVSKRGELSYQDFVHALSIMKEHLIFEVMDQLGISWEDMIVSLVWSINLLLLMFAFIFVGIAAFSPASSFSSVTNALMPLAAGFTVNKKTKEEEKPEDLKEQALEATSL